MSGYIGVILVVILFFVAVISAICMYRISSADSSDSDSLPSNESRNRTGG